MAKIAPLKPAKVRGIASPQNVAIADAPVPTETQPPVLRIRGAAMQSPKSAKGRKI